MPYSGRPRLAHRSAGISHLDARTQVWFKEDSPVTLSGSKITAVTESSTNAYAYTQGTDAQRPLAVSGVLNGLRVYRFDGSDDSLLGPNAGSALTLLNGQVEAWIFAVTKSSSTNDAFRYAGLVTSDDGFTGGSAYIALQTSGGGPSFVNVPCAAGRSNLADSYSTKYSATSVGTAWAMALIRIRFPLRIGIVNVDGAADESGTMAGMTATPVDANAKRSFLFGNTFAGTSPFAGDVAELLFGTGKLTESERDALFGYAAHKWALTSNLPSGHPYKTSGPGTGFLAALA